MFDEGSGSSESRLVHCYLQRMDPDRRILAAGRGLGRADSNRGVTGDLSVEGIAARGTLIPSTVANG